MIFEDARAYAGALGHRGVLLGLDLGTRTIGTAFCDADWLFASPGPLVRRTKFAKDRTRLADIIASRDTRGLVLGLPRNMDGGEGPRGQATRAFARNIADLGLPILLWDERWSTQAVERAMIAADMSRKKRAERIDSAAAAYILEGAIEALRGA
jgi:putative Holliday junction resolvase